MRKEQAEQETTERRSGRIKYDGKYGKAGAKKETGCPAHKRGKGNNTDAGNG